MEVLSSREHRVIALWELEKPLVLPGNIPITAALDTHVSVHFLTEMAT